MRALVEEVVHVMSGPLFHAALKVTASALPARSLFECNYDIPRSVRVLTTSVQAALVVAH